MSREHIREAVRGLLKHVHDDIVAGAKLAIPIQDVQAMSPEAFQEASVKVRQAYRALATIVGQYAAVEGQDPYFAALAPVGLAMMQSAQLLLGTITPEEAPSISDEDAREEILSTMSEMLPQLISIDFVTKERKDMLEAHAAVAYLKERPDGSSAH
jgi:hypothetical protein